MTFTAWNPYPLARIATILVVAACGRSSPAQESPAPSVWDLAPSEEFVEVHGITTHHVARGDRGTAIVLIHGFGSSTYTWRRSLETLDDEFRVHALDLKGFGLTERPRDGQYHAMAYSGHLLGFLDAMKLDRPILVGHSMGGAVALIVALRHPDRVGGLVLVDAALPDFQPPELDLADGDHDGKLLEASHGGDSGDRTVGMRLRPSSILLRALITRKSIESGLRASFRDPSLVTPEMVEAYFLPTTVDGAMEALSAMFDPPDEALAAAENLPRLESLRMPTLVVWGRHDQIIPPAVADQLVRRIAGARKVILEESGHLPHEEQPERFNGLVADFARQFASQNPSANEPPSR